jgi:hypothetical protein
MRQLKPFYQNRIITIGELKRRKDSTSPVTLSHELVTYRSKDEHLAVYVLHKQELVITIWHMLTQNC